jgi:L-rhamnose isomerase/sugar isomerase|tara:strand:+ start:258 stop:482 length:225 start_codon:yes stop_codon:yes gene_type:complete
LVDQEALKTAQQENDLVKCQEVLQEAYRTDVRSLLEKADLNTGRTMSPIKAYRELDLRNQLIGERGKHTIATGL